MLDRFTRLVKMIYDVIMEYGIAGCLRFIDFCEMVELAYRCSVPAYKPSIRNFVAAYLVVRLGWKTNEVKYIASTIKGMREWKNVLLKVVG